MMIGPVPGLKRMSGNPATLPVILSMASIAPAVSLLLTATEVGSSLEMVKFEISNVLAATSAALAPEL